MWMLILSCHQKITSDLILLFGIYFKDSMAKLDKGAEITAVAAIVKHNTSVSFLKM